MTQPRFDTVFFDSGGTLYMESAAHTSPTGNQVREQQVGRLKFMLAGFGFNIPQELITQTLDHCAAECRKQFGAGFNFDRLMAAMSERLGLNLGPEVQACLSHAYTGPRYRHWLYPGTLEMLSKLTDAGVYLGVIANTAWPGHCMDRAFAGVGILPYMQTRLYSGDIGLEKPDPAFFRLAEKVSGRSGKRVLYVGDRYDKDVVGAHAAGWSCALRGQPPQHQPRNADLEFSTWDELTEFILAG